MTVREPRYLEALERRAKHLRKRLEGLPRDALSFDRQEASALGWAIANLRPMVEAKAQASQPLAAHREERTQTRTRDFPAVKEAAKAARAQMGYYREMMGLAEQQPGAMDKEEA